MEAQAAQQQQQQQQWMINAQAQQQPHPSPATATAAAVTYSSQPYHQPTTHEEVRTLWIGDLPYWADESYLHSWFSHTGEVCILCIIFS